MSSTPPSVNNGAWDPKIVLGEATVYADGSALFEAPARTPVYFQVLDATNRVIQTMRSWSTLQPGERFACVGCHEAKNAAPVLEYKPSLAMRAGVQRLVAPHGAPRGFSFNAEVQPILDRHCIRCHNDRAPVAALFMEAGKLRVGAAVQPAKPGAFSLLAATSLDRGAQRKWSDAYLRLTCCGASTPLVNWISPQSRPPVLPPYFAGSARSGLLPMLEKGHHDVKLARGELDTIACWIDLLVPYCGDYREANAWTPAEVERYEHFLAKRAALEAQDARNVAALLARPPPAPHALP